MNNPLISIIVPVYNVEKHISECIESLLNQTYQNLEIVLVDDGSTDESGKICDKFAQKDNRIKVYHKPNGGVSSARNYGLEKATGKYISFCDSDDQMTSQMIEKLFNALQEHNVKMAMCGYKQINDNGEKDHKKESRLYCIDAENDLFEIISSPELNLSAVWNKMFEASEIKKLKFDHSISWGEDQIFVFDFLKNNKEFFYVGEMLYVYNYKNSNLSKSLLKNYIEKNIILAKRRSQFLNEICLNETPAKQWNYYSCIKPLFAGAYLEKKFNDKKTIKKHFKKAKEEEIIKVSLKKLKPKGMEQKLVKYCVKHNNLFVPRVLLGIRNFLKRK